MEQRMTITLNQAAIETALVDYIAKMGINTQGKTTEVSLTAGRKENGYSADVTIITGLEATSSAPVIRSVQSTKVEEPVAVQKVEQEVDEAPFETEEIQEEETVKPKKAANLFGG